MNIVAIALVMALVDVGSPLPTIAHTESNNCAGTRGCYESPQGCYHWGGVHGDEKECGTDPMVGLHLVDHGYCRRDPYDKFGTTGPGTPHCDTCVGRGDGDRNRCPWMCGYCRTPHATSETCAKDPNCHESQKGCFYNGKQGTAEKCKKMGDDSRCRKVTVDCYSCRDPGFVEVCPYMCGYCPHRPVTTTTATCASDRKCYESPAGCFHIGQQGSEAECRRLGPYKNGTDDALCKADGSGSYECMSCPRFDTWGKFTVYNDKCPRMCGYCKY